MAISNWQSAKAENQAAQVSLALNGIKPFERLFIQFSKIEYSKLVAPGGTAT
ncbi:MAG TPA: hypothetical protein VJA94_12945 [Candidatus Angelobacter sp.]